MRKWSDYIALERMGDVVRTLGAFSAKDGYAFEVARAMWPEAFEEGRGSLILDEKPGVRSAVARAG